jgi:hypothetical protein
MRRAASGLVAAVVLAAGTTAVAHGQTPNNDPEAGSPSGVIYEIPLDAARRDAAPRGSVADGPSAVTTSGSSTTTATGSPASPSASIASSLHSENGFGSSAQVPGLVADRNAGSSTAKPGERDRRDATQREAGRRDAVREALIPPSATTAKPSSARAYLLLGLAVTIALGVGVAARLAARGR